MATQRLSDERLAEIRELRRILGERFHEQVAVRAIADLLAEIERLKLALELK